MKNLEDKIKFNFLYRDEGNYKTFSYEIFNNSNEFDISNIEEKIRLNFIDSKFFYPEELGIKKFSFHNFEFDNSWYEFESVEKVSIMKDPIRVEKYRDITKLLESTP